MPSISQNTALLNPFEVAGQGAELLVPHSDDIGPEAFGAGGEKAALRDTINNNFALSTDKNGKVKIDIAWESGVHALSGLMAHFSVEAPTDAAFLKNIGVD